MVHSSLFEMHDNRFIIEEIKKEVRHNQQLIIGKQPLTFFSLQITI